MRAFPLIGALLLLSACEYHRVQTDFNPAIPIASYRTYSWLPSEAPRGMNPLMFERVKASIDRSLAARGYTQANPADFAIGFTVGERDRIESDDGYGWAGPGWGGWGWGGWGGWGWGGCCGWGGWGGWGGYPDIYTVTERSIIIDVFDGKTHQPAWHGVVSRDSYSGRVDYMKLDRAVDAVLAQFPPQPGTHVSSY